jgi:hypothetical protein
VLLKNKLCFFKKFNSVVKVIQELFRKDQLDEFRVLATHRACLEK